MKNTIYIKVFVYLNRQTSNFSSVNISLFSEIFQKKSKSDLIKFKTLRDFSKEQKTFKICFNCEH